MGDAATYERDGHVATITYNRPEKLNAINGELRRDLNAAWERFRDDEDAWVAIVTGAGRRSASAPTSTTAPARPARGRARSGRSRPSTRSSRAWRSGSRRSPR